MCDNCSNADARSISGTSTCPKTMSFRNAALTPAALVRARKNIVMKKFRDASRSGWLTSLIWSMTSFSSRHRQ